MRTGFLRGILFGLLMVVALICEGQGAAAVSLNAKARAEIVNTIGKLLVENYVFPDTALQMSEKIKLELKKGQYDKLSDPVDFSDRLMKDLATVYHDRHLLVQYNPGFAAQLAGTGNSTGGSREGELQRLREGNYGFKKVEVLAGNIGYINLNHCWADRGPGLETMKAALKLVENTRALVIDIRENGGGSQEAVTLLVGYFLKEATHLESFYNRTENTVTEYWTEVDSAFRALEDIPLYILTSDKSFSAAEMLAYDLQALKRATVVGEVTGGGAHGEREADASHGFVLHVPFWRGINAVTHTNWETVGVKPDILASSARALEVAEMKIFESMLSKARDSVELFQLKWERDLAISAHHPVVIDTVTLKRFAGVYGERTFTFEDGKLYYQRTGRPKYELEPMTGNVMKGVGNTYFKIEFVESGKGEVNRVNAHYQDNRLEVSYRDR
jgi:retinol-binding protein 3